MDLSDAYHEAMAEGSRLRFKLNFGTPICEGCSGLRVGPDVVATCFQVKRCDYTNIKEGVATPMQRKLIQGLSNPRKV